MDTLKHFYLLADVLETRNQVQLSLSLTGESRWSPYMCCLASRWLRLAGQVSLCPARLILKRFLFYWETAGGKRLGSGRCGSGAGEQKYKDAQVIEQST